MTTPQIGNPISLEDVQDEFSGSNPISISEYYDSADGVPSSGEISLDDFYNVSSSIVGEHLTEAGGSWTVPAGVTSISVICVGPGGKGCPPTTDNNYSGGGGGGGALAYVNNFSVIPGDVLNISIDNTGSTVFDNNDNAFILAGAGENGRNNTTYYYNQGGTYDLFGNTGGGGNGGYGGLGHDLNGNGGGGGGAGGYSGTGGNGGDQDHNPAVNPDGAGGAGGGGKYCGCSISGLGGGVDIFGIGSSGAAGTFDGQNCNDQIDGEQGSRSVPAANPKTMKYGGGGGGRRHDYSYQSYVTGGAGVVRIIYPGNERSFPSTRTAIE